MLKNIIFAVQTLESYNNIQNNTHMKKISLFFITLLAVLVTGCDNDDYYERDSSDTNQSKTAHWYGVKQLADSVSLRSAADRMKLWSQDPVITVKFLNSPDNPAILDQIKTYAKEWEQYAGVTFNFVETSENALVRIGFDWDGNSWLTWSYTGNDAKMVRNQSEPTACFGGFSDGMMSDEEIKGDVLRVFGQILGLEFEQRHQGWEPSWWKKDKNGVYYAEKYWEGMFDGYYENLDWETIRQFVFDPLAGATIVQTADVDFESIMMWPYYTKKETVKLYANYELSDGDKEFIATLYPKKEGNTIQTAWVDAGYFVWANAEKTQLRITEKGALMEELPDVIDGEQLTSAKEMFYERNKRMNLRKAPKFNSSNITNFERMFQESFYLKEIPYYDTSKGVIFTSMFYYCSSLKNIPLIDTSSGQYFGAMLANCESLTEIPHLDTSNGLDFEGMFGSCKNLKTIPLINTSKGIRFSRMFMYSGVVEIPNLNFSNGIDFDFMFESSKIKKINIADLSKGTTFYEMFRDCDQLIEVSLPTLPSAKKINIMFMGCTSLKTVSTINAPVATSTEGIFRECKALEVSPQINLPKTTSLKNLFQYCESLSTVSEINAPMAKTLDMMFWGCTSLKSVPLFDTSKVETMYSMFGVCHSLINVPEFNTSNVTCFTRMFDTCLNLKSVPEFNTSKGEDFGDMFYGCISLKSVPSFDTSNARVFFGMFYKCQSLEDLPELCVAKGSTFQDMFGAFYSSNFGQLRNLRLKGFGQTPFKPMLSSSTSPEDSVIDIVSPVLEVSSLQYLINNTTGGVTLWTVNLNKALQSKVSAELIAQAAAKNIKFEFIY